MKINLLNIYLFCLAHEPKYINTLQKILLEKDYKLGGIYEINKETIISNEMLNDIEYQLDERNGFMGAVTISEISKFSKEEDEFSIIIYLINKIKIYYYSKNEI